MPWMDARLQTPDVVDRQALRIEENRGWLVNEAARHQVRFPTVSFEDLMQMGMVAIVLADQRFSDDRGCSFIGYAKFWIRALMGRLCWNTGNQVRTPVHQWVTAGVRTCEVSLNEPLKGDRGEGRRNWEDVLPAAASAEALEMDAETEWDALRMSIGELKPIYRVALEKHFLEEKSMREVAVELGITNQGVHLRVNKALRMLRGKARLRALRAATGKP